MDIGNKMKINKIFAYLFVALAYTINIFAVEIDAKAISQNKSMLALAYDDTTIHIYSLKDAKTLHVLKGHEKTIQSLDFNEDGTKLISGSWGDKAIIWSMQDGSIIKEKKTENTVIHAFFTADDKYIILSEDDDFLTSYDEKLNKKLKTFNIGTTLQISKSKKMIAGQVGYDVVGIADIFNNKMIMEFKEKTSDEKMFFNDDETMLLVMFSYKCGVWDIVNKKKLRDIPFSNFVEFATLSKYHKNEIWVTMFDTLVVWDYLTGEKKGQFVFKGLDIENIVHVSFSPNGKTAALSIQLKSGGSKALIVDSKTFKIKSTITTSSKSVYETEFLDNKLLYVDSLYPVEVWNIEKNKNSFTFVK